MININKYSKRNRILKYKSCCCCNPRPSCPIPFQCICPPVTLNESPACTQLIDNLDGIPFVQGEFEYIFFARLVDFNEASSGICQLVFAPDAHLANVQELIPVANKFLTTTPSGPTPCPILVWTTINGIPTLAYLLPGCPESVRVIPTHSLHCRAYFFCVHPAITI